MRSRAVNTVQTLAILAGLTWLPSSAHAYETERTFDQPESRDEHDRITVEAATVHVISCKGAGENGAEVYIFEYLNRSGFRAVRSLSSTAPIGGVEFSTLEEAATTACSEGVGAPRPEPPPRED